MHIFLISGIIIIFIGLLTGIISRIIARNTEIYPAEIIAIRDKTVSRGRTAQRLFCPVVKYKWFSKEKTAEHYAYVKMADIHLRRGDKVNICINRRNPQKFYFANDSVPSSPVGAVITAVGIALSLLGIIIMIVR